MDKIHFGPVEIDPIAYASMGNAILGIRDSGKTGTAHFLAEGLIGAGIPFTAFDPAGVWRWLRVPGRGQGFPVVVAGGVAGDLPLTVDSAPSIVEAAMQNGVSVVIDLFSMELSKADWRRIVTSCLQLLLHKNRGLRHIFIEEAAEFAPQRVRPGEGVVYAEVEKLARMGGNMRLGYTLINQRAEEVNKAILELCDNLMLHRQKGKNSLNSLGKWLAHSNAANLKEVMASFATLPTGECWAWLRQEESPTRIKVPLKSSAYPQRRALVDDDADMPAAVDVGQFVAAMKAALDKPKGKAVKETPQSDKQAAASVKPAPEPVIEEEEEVSQEQLDAAERRGVEIGRKQGFALACQQIAAMLRVHIQDASDLEQRITALTPSDNLLPIVRLNLKKDPETDVRPVPVPKKAPKVRSADDPLSTGAVKLLNALARYQDSSRTMTWDQVGTVAGMVPGNGYFNGARKELREHGLVVESPTTGLTLSADGIGACTVDDESGFGQPPKRSEIADLWCAKLGEPAASMLRYLLKHGDSEVDAVASAIGLKPGNGYWNGGRKDLRSAGLIEPGGGKFVLTSIMRGRG